MYLFLILFFISLIGVSVMMGRKIYLMRNGQLVKFSHRDLFVPDIEKIKINGLRGLKRFGYIGTFIVLRLSILSYNFLKRKGKIVIKKIQNKIHPIEKIKEQKEVSKYLRAISEYRKKIRQMKDRIKEEEGIE